MQLLKHKICWPAFVVILIASACTKQYKNYEDFIKDGPIVYPGRADSVKALAGNERILLSWKIPSDLNITNYKIFWNFGGDSLDIAGRKPGAGDSIRIFIPLSQGAYNFTVYSYDAQGHRSVGTNAIGNVYGSIFSSIIFNRPIRGVKKEAANSLVSVGWVGLDAKCIATEWTYTDVTGVPVRFFSPLGDSTFITDCNVAEPISYRSLFLPETNAIDTFFTEFKSL